MSQIKKDKHCILSFTCGIKKSQIYKNKEYNGGYQRLGEGGGMGEMQLVDK